jgi:hypothetical protein
MTTKLSLLTLGSSIQNALPLTLATLTVTDSTYTPIKVTAIYPTGGYIKLTGTGFSAGCIVYVNGVAATSTTFVSTYEVRAQLQALSVGTYSLQITNPNNAKAIYAKGILYSTAPTWTTSAGSLGTIYEASSISNALVATSDSAITYSIVSGVLPTGLTLNATSGLISGTVGPIASSTTYNFVINAIDKENQDITRNFSYTVNPDAVSWSSPAENSTITGYINAPFSQSLTATSLAGKSITYTATSLPSGLSISGSRITGTPSALYAGSAFFTATALSTNRTATRMFVLSILPPPVGQVAYTTPGTYSWVAPAGVASVSVVAVGGGGGGACSGGNGGGDSGAGAGLGWKNAITVVPGQTYTVVVGTGGAAGTYNSGSNRPGSPGGDSYFISATIVKGGGGGGGVANPLTAIAGGTYIGDGGGNGGGNPASGGALGCSASGAGGYTGNGGIGVYYNGLGTGAGNPGSGGGGGSASYGYSNVVNGGGVGILGQGANGAGGTGAPGNMGAPNVSGFPGSGGVTIQYGGGGGVDTFNAGTGGGGAVRIIWGPGRAFPSTLTTDQ